MPVNLSVKNAPDASAVYGARLMKHRSSRVVDLALKILDGLDVRTIPRYADVMKKAPANFAIDNDALAREQAIVQRQVQ